MRKQYEAFDLLAVARRARNYLTRMVDDACDCLPYWFVQINENPAYARHVRVDDAELVASWYEAIVCVRHILGADARATAVEQAFIRHLLKSWGPQGLRYHEPYPWSNTNHASFHEMGYVLNALNRLLLEQPGHAEAEQRTRELVRGLRGLVVQRRTATFWSGDWALPEKVYEFPGDVYLRDGGFVPERVTGRGEECIRNAVLLMPLAVRADLFKDEVALDVAEGIANHLLGLSRYFNWKGEFFGHVHSAVWFAAGLARLGRITNNLRYVTRANDIYRYVLGLSSPFGWVPEYAQWRPINEEHCETCCIKDMIECGFELIDCGYDYWDVINKFTRNQLAEQQIQDGSFVGVDNTRDDKDGHTWRAMDERVVGGWSGGAEPNSLSLARFRSIAGCCVGTAPQALEMVWQRIVTHRDGTLHVNLPMTHTSALADVAIGYPNAGWLRVTAKMPGTYLVRVFDWMGPCLELTVDGVRRPVVFADGCVCCEDLRAGQVMTLAHPLQETVRNETARGTEYRVTWRGPDVVRMDPPGLPLKLYQRECGVANQYPQPAAAGSGPVSMRPTEQKR